MPELDDLYKSIYKKVKHKKNVLYHYTGIDKLKSIIENNQLWITDKEYLNDVYENSYPEKMFLKIIHKLEIDYKKKNYLKKYLCIPQYVFSLSTEFDLANQWLNYGKQEGCCIEFIKSDLVDYFKFGGNNIIIDGKVLYLNVEVRQLITEILEYIYKNDFLQRWNLSNLFESEKYAELVSMLFSLIKQSYYKCEFEYRLCVLFYRHAGPIYTRVDKNMLTPYIKIPDYSIEDNIRKLPIKRIIIGPTNKDPMFRKTLRQFLDANNYSNVKITQSNLKIR